MADGACVLMPADDDGLRRAAERLIRDWRLDLERPIIETPSGCVAFVRRGDMPAVLKVPRTDDDEANAAVVLRHYDGRGAVRVLEAVDLTLADYCATA